jgi:uncharacterized membrane protein YhhN
MKKYFFIVLFAIAATGVFAAILFNVKLLDYIFKPLIMIAVGGHFLVHSLNIGKKLKVFAGMAFLFSWMGDIFLMFPQFFIPGLGAFLFAQISYILLFGWSVKISGVKPYLNGNLLAFSLYFIYGSVLFSILLNHLDPFLKVAVFIYMVALIGMSVMALNRLNIKPRSGAIMVFTGSLFFIISDTLIAFNKFYVPIPHDRLLVMSTYMAAQFLIMKGFLKQFD